MKRILLLLTAAVMMAVLFAVAVGPALADHRFFRNHFDNQEHRSGAIDFDTDISIRGNNNNQCAGVLQFGNTGNFANQQGTSNYDNPDSEQEFEGFEVDFSPENETECDQRVQQASAASSWGW